MHEPYSASIRVFSGFATAVHMLRGPFRPMGIEVFFGARIGSTTGFCTRLYMGLSDAYACKADNHAYGDDFLGSLSVNHGSQFDLLFFDI